MLKNEPFICQNSQCTENFYYSTEQTGNDIDGNFECPNCKQKYHYNESGTLIKAFDELVFESFESFNDFIDLFDANNVKINKLVLENITDSINFRKIISFTNSVINEVIINRVTTETTCFPIAFINCKINKIIVSNTTINENPKKDFWGAYNFYGINIFNCKIIEDFIINNVETSLCISNSIIDCEIQIWDSRITELALLNSANNPKIIFDEKSTVNISTTELSEKLIKIKETTPLPGKDYNMVEFIDLEITSELDGEVTIKNSKIKNLIFKDYSNIQVAINLINCHVENVINSPKSFSRILNIKNCTFQNGLKFKNTIFYDSLIAEGCIFNQYFVLNEVKIEKDIHFSYSLFDCDLDIAHSNIGGYFFNHFSSVSGDFLIERSVFSKDIIMSSSYVGQNTMLEFNKIEGDVYFNKNMHAGLFDLNEIECRSVSIKSTNIKEQANIKNLKLETDLQLTDTSFSESVAIINTYANDIFLIMKSKFNVSLDLYYCEVKTCWIDKSIFHQPVSVSQVSLQKHSYIKNNIFIENANFSEIMANDIDIIQNKFTTEFSLNKSETDDLLIEQNQFEDFEIDSCICGQIEINKNTISSWMTMVQLLSSKSMKISENALNLLYGQIISSTFNNDLLINKNKFEGTVEILKTTVHQDFEFNNNDYEIEGQLNITKNKLNNFNVEGSKFYSPVFITDNVLSARLSFGSQSGKGSSERVVFSKGVYVSNNRLRSLSMLNTSNIEAFCFINNHVEGETLIKEGYFKKELDLSGSFFGGSVKLNNIDFSELLVLDDVFVDKRISFSNSTPKYFSFVGASLSGFQIPDNWQILRFSLRNTSSKMDYVINDDVLIGKVRNNKIPYNILKSYWQEDHDLINTLNVLWDDVIDNCINKENSEILEAEIEKLDDLLLYKDSISEVLKYNFSTIYYNIIQDGAFTNISKLAEHFKLFNPATENIIIKNAVESMQSFFKLFVPLLKSFKDGFIEEEAQNQKIKPFIKKKIYQNLMDQYMVVRQIYGDNGELSSEDKAYYQWMHYKNLHEMQTRSRLLSIISWFKWLIFEKVFGWGVALSRIVWSTLVMILIFSGIYKILFKINSDLFIQWDGNSFVAGTMSYDKVLLLSLQTTFGAFMGDWAPFGNSWIKLLMTINAVLGVLFVTFLIGAYGRKMLR